MSYNSEESFNLDEFKGCTKDEHVHFVLAWGSVWGHRYDFELTAFLVCGPADAWLKDANARWREAGLDPAKFCRRLVEYAYWFADDNVLRNGAKRGTRSARHIRITCKLDDGLRLVEWSVVPITDEGEKLLEKVRSRYFTEALAL